MNKENAKKLYKMGMAIFDYDDKVNPERMSIDEIVEDKNYNAVVGENQIKTIKQIIIDYLKEIKYIPKNVSLDNIATQMTSHYVACIENVFYKELALDSLKESVMKFLTICEPIENYDCEV